MRKMAIMNKELGKNFIIVSLIYFCVSVSMGTLMMISPIYMFVSMSTLFQRAHAHLSLIGWVSLAIIGIIYMVLARLGKPMYSERLGETGFALLSIGIFAEFVTLIIGGYYQASDYLSVDPNAHISTAPYTMFAVIFAFAMLVGAYMTVYNIYKTFNTK